MNAFREMIPILAPLIFLQLGLALFSLVHVLKHPNYKFGNKAMWCIVVLFIQFIGPIVYFVWGRGENE